MSVFSQLASLFVPPAPALEQRSIEPYVYMPDLQTQLIDLRRTRAYGPSVAESLGVPSVFRAVTLISNTTASLSLEVFRNGDKLAQDDAPRIAIRPNPFTTPQEFFRASARAMSTYGEAWWWTAARDNAGVALSLYPVPPNEIIVNENQQNRLRPEIRWRDRLMRNEDMTQIVLDREPGQLRGQGPLQVCGAAINVSVEAQQWAANFFVAGGVPSVLIKSALDLDSEEAEKLRAQWLEKSANTPKVIDPSVESVEFPGVDPSGAQLDQQRQYQVGDVARMFGIPGSLLEYSAPGSLLTYQNVEGEYTKFVRTCLAPNYLEPIEQAMSDLLTNRMITRFNVDALTRADVKTRYEVHKTAIDSGVYDAEYAQQQEGIAAGSVETAAVPRTAPAAVPVALPYQSRSQLEDVRCANCNRMLGRFDASQVWEIKCFRCGQFNRGLTA